MAKQVALRRAQEQDKLHARSVQNAGHSSPGDSQSSSINGPITGSVGNGSTSSTSATSGSGSSIIRNSGATPELNAGQVLSEASDRLTAALVNGSNQFSAFSTPTALSAAAANSSTIGTSGSGGLNSSVNHSTNANTGSSSPTDLMLGVNGTLGSGTEMDSGRTSYVHLDTGILRK